MDNYNNPRIELDDTTIDMVMKMSGGNPGAITVLAEVLQKNPYIDPDDFMGGLGPILGMDSHGIYEHRIWMLYKDVCGQSLVTMLGLLRAVQLGFLSDAVLDKAIDGDVLLSEGVISGYLAKVQERLPLFGKVVP